MGNKEMFSMLHPDSPVLSYLKWIDENKNDELYLKRYQSTVSDQKNGKHCFLTVIIRLQTMRPERLQDVLTCLQGQQDNDFEVILICQDFKEDEYRSVGELVSRQGLAFASGVRVIRVQDGRPGAAFNLGFACARGEYAVCLDDDALLLDHWVKVFHTAAVSHGQMLLRTYVMTQQWNEDCNTTDKRRRIAAAGAFDDKYCVPYHTIRQQPETGFFPEGTAYPLFLFRDLHILFNEEIPEGSERDYLLRAAGIAGVYDTEQITAIHRLWNAQDAAGKPVRKVDREPLEQNAGDMAQDIPLLLTAEEAGCCRQKLKDLQSAEQWGRSVFLNKAVLFWSDDNQPFSDDRHMTASVSMRDGWIRAVFPLEQKCREETITRLRIDPSEETLFALEQINVGLYRGNRLLYNLTQSDLQETNGFTDGTSIMFLNEDPMFVLAPGDRIPSCTVVFTARVLYHSPAALLQWIEEKQSDIRWQMNNRNTAHLYPDRGNGFLPEDCLVCFNVISNGHYRAEFTFSPESGKGIRELRFDPTEDKMLWLNELRIDIDYLDKTHETLRAGQIPQMNGFETGSGLAFIEKDPVMVFPAEEEKQLEKVTVTGTGRFISSEEMEDRFARAVRVPDYKLICEQLEQMRQTR